MDSNDYGGCCDDYHGGGDEFSKKKTKKLIINSCRLCYLLKCCLHQFVICIH